MMMKAIQSELNQINGFVKDIENAPISEKELEEICDDMCMIRSKLSSLYAEYAC